MNTAIFIRSYDKDFDWLSFALRSISKYAKGFQEVVVAVPEGQDTKLKHLTAERILTVHDGQPGYLAQQETKLQADIHTPKADCVLHVDADCVFTSPVTPETFMRDGKPVWMWTPWSELSGPEKKTWFHVMCKCLQDAPPGEFMRRHPSLIPKWAYGAFREFIEKTHGITLTQYVMNQPGHEFSEFNCIGFYLWMHHRDKISWWNTLEEGVPPKVLDQYWTGEPMHAGTRAWLQATLA